MENDYDSLNIIEKIIVSIFSPAGLLVVFAIIICLTSSTFIGCKNWKLVDKIETINPGSSLISGGSTKYIIYYSDGTIENYYHSIPDCIKLKNK